jgi:FkbM family methyltransferase
MNTNDARPLSIEMRALAAAMRWIPIGVRRVRWWWERTYRALGGGGFDECEAIDALWPAGEQAPIRARRSGQLMRLNLQDWCERRTYFSGQYFQEELEILLELLLRRGDQFIDVGANIGMISLIASRILGDGGKGFSFEPNPEVFRRLVGHFDLNHVNNLAPVRCAISDAEAKLTLNLPSNHTGKGTLVTGGQPVARSFSVRASTGQEYFGKLDPFRPTFIKIDVEGHELNALAGLQPVLRWAEIFALIEVNDQFLRRAGNSADELFHVMAEHGFESFSFALQAGRFRQKLILRRLYSWSEHENKDWIDVLFARPQSQIYKTRLLPALT